ncbi:MAG: DUF5675 family protein [Candidatus Aenigmatarchaeota archaeon]
MLKRVVFEKNLTKGFLYVKNHLGEDLYKCYTLEPETDDYSTGKAIKCGKYRVIMTYSKRFKKVLPEIIGVENRTGIRIHSGNYREDTSGCILVGEKMINDILLDSRKALGWIIYYINMALDKKEKVFINIEEDRENKNAQKDRENESVFEK